MGLRAATATNSSCGHYFLAPLPCRRVHDPTKSGGEVRHPRVSCHEFNLLLVQSSLALYHAHGGRDEARRQVRLLRRLGGPGSRRHEGIISRSLPACPPEVSRPEHLVSDYALWPSQFIANS